MSKLEGDALDEAVAKALGDEKPWGLRFGPDHPNRSMRGGYLVGTFTREEAFARAAQGFEPHLFKRYSTEWRDGGPIIERERILLSPYRPGVWRAVHLPSGDASPDCVDYGEQIPPLVACEAATPLIAAMRCFVASRTPTATGEKP